MDESGAAGWRRAGISAAGTGFRGSVFRNPFPRIPVGRVRSLRNLLVVMAAIILASPVPPARDAVAQDAPEQETPDESGGGSPRAVWRALRQDWLQGWNSEGSNRTNDFVDVDFPTSTVGFAALKSGTFAAPNVVRTANGGQTWAVVKTGGNVTALDFVDSGTGVAVADKVAGKKGAAIFRTVDSGATWSEVLVLDGALDLRDVAFAEPGHRQDHADGVAVAVGSGGKIFRSIDGGTKWTQVSGVPVTEDLNAIAFANRGSGAVGVAVGDHGTVLHTTDGGDHWSVATVSLPAGQQFPSDNDPADPGSRVDLFDVTLATDQGAMLGVAVGEEGAVLRTLSDDAGAWDGPIATPLSNLSGLPNAPTVAEPVGVVKIDADGDGGPPDLTAVALADVAPDISGGLVGYAVGERLTVLEMQGDRGDGWDIAPVDSRTLSQSQPFNYPQITNGGQHLSAVSVGGKGNDVTALAVGTFGAMVKRTPISDPEQLRQEITDDEWWRCVPVGQTQGTPAGDAVEEAQEGVQGTPAEGVVVPCRVGQKPIPAPSRFGSTPAQACELEAGEALSTEFPCLRSWQPVNESGGLDGVTSQGAVASQRLFLDPGFEGEGRRVVLVRQSQNGAIRVFLFDPERVEQRGVNGFGGLGSGAGREADFSGSSVFGFETGVVNLADAPTPMPDRLSVPRSTYDETRHRLFLPTETRCVTNASCLGIPPRIVTLSINGEFPPALTTIPIAGADGRTNVTLTHVALDATHGMLYAVTETNPYRDQVLPFPVETFSTRQVTLHAFESVDPGATETGALALRWSLPLEGRCHTTWDLPYLGVSRDGDSIALGCQGHSFPHFGAPAFESHKIITIELKLGGEKHPRQLNPTSTTDVAFHTEPIGGIVLDPGQDSFGVDDRNLLAWNQSDGANLWDFDQRGWIGTVPFPGLLDGSAHPDTGRLYLRCRACLAVADSQSLSDGLLLVDTLNLPVDKVNRQMVPTPALSGATLVVPATEADFAPLVFGPRADRPDTPEVLETGAISIYEDRVPGALPRRRQDPDVDTHDIAENDASFVTRIGRANAYGARLWWTGLSTALPGSCHPIDLQCAEEPVLTYDWLFDPANIVQNPVGSHTSVLPVPPGAGARELRTGLVQRAALEDAHATARARSIFYDGAPGESGGNTGGDLKRRRGARDAHDFADAEIAQFCEIVFPPAFVPEEQGKKQCERQFLGAFESQHQGDPTDPNDADGSQAGFDDQFGPWEFCADEAVDVVMREVDGDRRMSGCDPEGVCDKEGASRDCFGQPEDLDPRDEDPATPEAERPGLEERLGHTYASECLDPGQKNDQYRGSRTRCDGAGGRTEASAASGGLSLVPAEGQGASGYFSVGSTRSEARIRRDSAEGAVVEVSAVASDIELGMPGQGSVSIGEVRTTARARAKGRPGTAQSWVDIAYEDVAISGPGGEHRFACGRSNPADPTGLRGDDQDSPAPACDPHRVVEVMNQVFTDKVRATTSAPDSDREVTGSDGGAQAIVRRDLVAVMSDQVIDRVQGLYELPGLQLTIYNDGMRPNRVRIDLAAVYAEAKYFIGGPRREDLPVPGSVSVDLSDPMGTPLPGGSFTILEDADGDGAVGSTDVPRAECTTDDTGTCTFDDLRPGQYLVEQRIAPIGFVREDSAIAAFVAEGSSESVQFVNAPDHGAVEVELVDPAGRALAGGSFSLATDADSDGTVGPSDRAVVSCTTGSTGLCRFEPVSLGGWVLHQSAAPSGFETSEKVAFALSQPGQVARIRVVNGTGVAGAQLEIVEIVSVRPASDPSGGSWLGRLPKNLADILLRDPIQALLFGLTVLLFGAPAYLALRRRELGIAKEAS